MSSKFEKGNGKCLHLQIKYNDKQHVVFTGSGNLMEQIEQVPKDKFPFETIIEEDDKRLMFT